MATEFTAAPVLRHRRASSELALVSLISGIVGLFVWPFAILAVVTGHISRARIEHGSGETGAGKALAGVIMGWISVAFGGFILLVFLIAAASAVVPVVPAA